MINMMNALIIWIEEQLEAREWSQGELARRADISAGGITDILSGNSAPSYRRIVKIARAFEFPPATLLQIAGLLPSAPEATPSLQEAQYLFSKLSDVEQERFLAMMRVIVEMEREPERKTVR